MLSEEIVASGDWYYQDEINYSAKLLKQVWNYTSFDLDEMYDRAIDYVSYDVSDEGVIYIWHFEKEGTVFCSRSFSTFFKARDHLDTYGYRYEIRWP